MSDKSNEGLVIAAVAAPVVLLCCLGPVVLSSVLGGIVGWFSGLNVVAGAAVAVAMSLLVYGFLRWRRARGITKVLRNGAVVDG